MSASITIPLSESTREWLDEQAVKAGSSPAEYVRNLLDQERVRLLRARIDHQLAESINSGPSTPMTSDDWDRLKASARQRAGKYSEE